VRQIVKKILPCADVAMMRDADKKIIARARNFFCAWHRRRNTIVARSPYFIAIFAIVAHGAHTRVALSPRAVSRCVCKRLTTSQRASRGANTRFVKSNTVFFIAL
jgi:hypothetical protein